jgi:hypothetical protein
MSLLLVTTLVDSSCSNGNDESPSQADDIEAISALYASIVPLIASDGVDGLFTLYANDVVVMVPDRWTDLDRQEAVAFYTEGLDWGKPDPDNYSITIDEVVHYSSHVLCYSHSYWCEFNHLYTILRSQYSR